MSYEAALRYEQKRVERSNSEAEEKRTRDRHPTERFALLDTSAMKVTIRSHYFLFTFSFFCGSVPIYFNWSDSKVFGGSRVTFFMINISKNNDAQFKVGPICKSNYRRKSPSLRLHIVFVKDNSIINLAYMMLLFEELLEKKIFG